MIIAALYYWASLVAQMIKNLPAMWETRVQSLVGKIPWRRQWLLTPVFLPGEFHRQRSFSSVQFSCSVVSDSLQSHESQHARPLCPSPTPGVHSNSCPLSQWCHPAISSSVIPFSSCSHPFQHQSLFQWVNSSHEMAKVLEFQPQHQSFQWTPRTGLL